MDGLAGVLFDMDGTLLDSQRLWDVALDALAARHGGALSAWAHQAMMGRSWRDAIGIFYQDLGVRDADPDTDGAFVAGQMAKLFATDLTWRPGAAELLSQVRTAGLPAALVTTTRRRLVELALDGPLGRTTFNAVVCGEDVTRSKPHPEPYLSAADRLGVPIGRCVAVEDSTAGVESARTAGAVVLAVTSETAVPAVEGVHIVPSLVGVDLSYLVKLCDGRTG